MRVSQQFASFRDHKYLNLETFRKSGAGVPTPVWFLLDGGKLYVRTPAQSGKVKRVRSNGRARVAPCDRMGGLLGEWQPARARLITDDATLERVNRLLTEKYGLLKRFTDFLSGLRHVGYEIILLEPPGAEANQSTP